MTVRYVLFLMTPCGRWVVMELAASRKCLVAPNVPAHAHACWPLGAKGQGTWCVVLLLQHASSGVRMDRVMSQAFH